jgi:hypothetical protein
MSMAGYSAGTLSVLAVLWSAQEFLVVDTAAPGSVQR